MRIRNRAELQRVRLTKSPFSCNGSVNVVARTRHGDEMGSLVSDTQSALPRHRARCNRKPGNGTRAVFVAISGTSASRERFQRVSTRLTRTHLYLRSETLFSLCPPPWTSGHHCHWTLYFSFVFLSFFFCTSAIYCNMMDLSRIKWTKYGEIIILVDHYRLR